MRSWPNGIGGLYGVLATLVFWAGLFAPGLAQATTLGDISFVDSGASTCLSNAGFVATDDVNSITTLDCSQLNITSIDDFTQLPELTNLVLSGNAIGDASALANLPNLVSVDLSDNHLVTLPDLTGLAALTSLDVSNNAITTFTLIGSYIHTLIVSDQARPDLLGLTISPDVLDLDSGSTEASISVTTGYLASGSGTLSSPGGLHHVPFTLASNSALGTATVTLDPHVEKGTWYVSDLVINGYPYNSFALAQFGADTIDVQGTASVDTTPPTLNGFGLSPAWSVDISQQPSVLDLYVAAVDDISGTALACQSTVTLSRDGNSNTYCLPAGPTPAPGATAMEFKLPLLDANDVGHWQVDSLKFVDNTGNTRTYTYDDIVNAGMVPYLDVTGTPSITATIDAQWVDTSNFGDDSRRDPHLVFDMSQSGFVAFKVVGTATAPSLASDASTGDVRYDASGILVEYFDAGEHAVTVRQPNTASGNFSVQVYGPATNIALDTDGDGTPDAADDDIDGDGISNATETADSLDPYNFVDGVSDPDNDGVSTADEIAAGTDWTDRYSYPGRLRTSEITFADPQLQKCVLATGEEYIDHIVKLECGAYGIADLTGIDQLTFLTSLNLAENLFRYIDVLGNMTQLTSLDLSKDLVYSIAPIARLTNLTKLRLNGTRPNLRYIKDLTALTWLELASNKISLLDDLAGLTNLRLLDLTDNNIVDVSPLAGLTQLDSLYLRDNAINDVSPIAGLSKINSLDLSNNALTDISPIANITRIGTLAVSGNELTDLSSLATLPFIGQIVASDNHLTTLPPLEGIASYWRYADIDISNNAIDDLSGLASWPGYLVVKSDADRPKLLSASLTPSSADLGDAGTDIYLDLAFDQSVRYVSGRLVNASGKQKIAFSGYNPEHIDIHIPANAPKGTWHVDYIRVNNMPYNDFLLAARGAGPVSLTGPQPDDTRVPLITGLAVTGDPGLDVSNGTVTIQLTPTVIEDYSGTSSCYISLIQPSRRYRGANCFITDHVGTATLYVNGLADVGTWQVISIELADNVGNEATFSEAQLYQNGIQTRFEVTGTPLVAGQAQGQWVDTTNAPDSPLANPHFRFEVTSEGYVVIDVSGDLLQREMIVTSPDALTSSQFAYNHFNRYLYPGHYDIEIKHTVSTPESFTIKAYGAAVNSFLDTDDDGIADGLDSDIDGDGIPNAAEVQLGLDPLDFTDATADPDQDGYSTATEWSAGSDWQDQASVPSTTSFDIDGDGQVSALHDGMLVVRYLFGFTGQDLYSSANAAGRTRSDAEILDYLRGLGTEIDIDGDGNLTPLGDGLMILRSGFDYNGTDLTRGAPGPACTRCTAEAVQLYLQLHMH